MTRTNAERAAAGLLVTRDGVAEAPNVSTTLDSYHEEPIQEFDFRTVDDAHHGTGVDATPAERTTLWQTCRTCGSGHSRPMSLARLPLLGRLIRLRGTSSYRRRSVPTPRSV